MVSLVVGGIKTRQRAPMSNKNIIKICCVPRLSRLITFGFYLNVTMFSFSEFTSAWSMGIAHYSPMLLSLHLSPPYHEERLLIFDI